MMRKILRTTLFVLWFIVPSILIFIWFWIYFGIISLQLPEWPSLTVKAMIVATCIVSILNGVLWGSEQGPGPFGLLNILYSIGQIVAVLLSFILAFNFPWTASALVCGYIACMSFIGWLLSKMDRQKI